MTRSNLQRAHDLLLVQYPDAKISIAQDSSLRVERRGGDIVDVSVLDVPTNEQQLQALFEALQPANSENMQRSLAIIVARSYNEAKSLADAVSARREAGDAVMIDFMIADVRNDRLQPLFGSG